jgi:hypothetical protein
LTRRLPQPAFLRNHDFSLETSNLCWSEALRPTSPINFRDCDGNYGARGSAGARHSASQEKLAPDSDGRAACRRVLNVPLAVVSAAGNKGDTT